MMTTKTTVPDPPIHPLSAVVTIALDAVWLVSDSLIGAIDISRFTFLITILLIAVLGVIGFVGVFLIQKFVEGDNLGTSLSKGFVMAIVAAVPIPIVVRTPLGVLLLAWAGVHSTERMIRSLGSSKKIG